MFPHALYSCFWNIFYLGHDFLFLEKTRFDFIEVSFIRAVMLNLLYQFWFGLICFDSIVTVHDISMERHGMTLKDCFLAPQMFSAMGFWQAVASVRFQSQQPKARPRNHLPRPAKRLALRVGWGKNIQWSAVKHSN